jgi:Cu(I)-responsive transcriptional regulator
MRIGELAALSGMKVVTIRYYEATGLISAPIRSRSGYRIYRPDHLQRLTFLRRCRELGFSIEEVRDLLSLTENPRQSCASVTTIAARHLDDVRSKLDDLQRLQQALDSLVASCRTGRVRDCKILQALTTAPQSSGTSYRPPIR